MKTGEQMLILKIPCEDGRTADDTMITKCEDNNGSEVIAGRRVDNYHRSCTYYRGWLFFDCFGERERMLRSSLKNFPINYSAEADVP